MGCTPCQTRCKDKQTDNSNFATNNCHKLNVINWLDDVPTFINSTYLVEVRFKNTRKEYFRNIDKLSLKVGDFVAVESTSGHDIGLVSLVGELVISQLKKNRINYKREEDLKKIYRKAKQTDLDKWKESIDLEIPAMLKARKFAEDLKLNMKIGDVEFQGDRTKAIFYYIADERVDFRELIKLFASEFKVKIEMRQIGARQEAGRIGGIGSCGRELCCASWVSNFVSVTTNAARQQEMSLNPQKLAGQCSKLKCCLNFEVASYIDERKDFPNIKIPLETKDGTYYHQKTDVFKRMMWYSSDKNVMANLTAIPVDRVKEIIEENKTGKSVDVLTVAVVEEVKELDYENVIGADSLTRFDQKKRKKKKKPKKKFYKK